MSSHWSYNEREAIRAIARKARAHKLAMTCYGVALYTAKNGHRPVIHRPVRSRLSADVASLSPEEKQRLRDLLLS